MKTTEDAEDTEERACSCAKVRDYGAEKSMVMLISDGTVPQPGKGLNFKWRTSARAR